MVRNLSVVVTMTALLMGVVSTGAVNADEMVLVAFGDSTTATRDKLTVYPTLMERGLAAKSISAKVINAGVPGNTTADALTRFEKDVIARNPSVVVIQFGLNDVAVDVWKDPPATGPRVSPEQYEKNLRYFVATLKNRHVKVVLMTPNPCRWTELMRKLYGKPPYRPDDPDGLNVVLLKRYADTVRRLAGEEKVTLIDVYQAFEMYGKEPGHSVDDLLLDGIHPNNKGHELVAKRLLASEPFACKTKIRAASGGSAAAQNTESKTAPELIVDVDVNSEVWSRNHTMTVADVRTLVSQLKQNGCQTLIVRCGCLGILPYRTTLSYPVGYDAKHARANPAPNDMIPDMESEIARRMAWHIRHAEVIRNFNPPEVFIREGREQGMKVLVWIDIFDDFWPGYRSKFLEEHPQCQWVGKDGKTYFKGLTDYAWPEARAFRVAQARELLDLGADGIHCSTSAHCRHMHNVHEEDFYGYSQPIVAAFQAKYGVDIRTAKDFDKAAWHDLKGDAMVQLYRDLAKVCHDRHKELWIGLQLGRHTQFAADPYFSANVVARYTNHWKTLVDDRIADAFILGDFEIASSPNSEYWGAKKDIRRREGEDLFAWAAREYQSYCQGKTRLYLFSEWLPNDTPDLAKRLRFWADITRANGFDGIDVHEACNLETKPNNMPELGKMAERLRAYTDTTP